VTGNAAFLEEFDVPRHPLRDDAFRGPLTLEEQVRAVVNGLRRVEECRGDQTPQWSASAGWALAGVFVLLADCSIAERGCSIACPKDCSRLLGEEEVDRLSGLIDVFRRLADLRIRAGPLDLSGRGEQAVHGLAKLVSRAGGLGHVVPG
jgi:hypothetical protein